MKNLTKTVFFIFALALSQGLSRCMAAEVINVNLGNDYIITTDKTVKANEVSNPAILTISPFFTIFNEKNVLLLHPSKVGKTNLTFFMENSTASFEIVVKPSTKDKSVDVIKKGDFEFNLLDAPPQIKEIEEELELDAPPTTMEGK